MKWTLFALGCLLSFSTYASLSEESITLLKERRNDVRSWARICADGSLAHSEECPFGDGTIFSGLSCISGEKDRCEDVRRSQSSTGEWFRAPGLVDKHSEWPSFSRDQSKGVMAYLVATKDTEAAKRWMRFLESNDGKLCPKSEKKWDACNTPVTWWIQAGRVWDYLGLERTKRMKDSNFVVEDIYAPMEARMQPNDYPLHLTAIDVYLRRELEKRTGKQDRNHKVLAKLTRIINKRSPKNPFFNYIKYGPTEDAAEVVLEYCPKVAPAPINGHVFGDWMWQRSIHDTLDGREELTWNYPGGHECIFMINLLVGATP